nr:MAG TPA_asm: hypothetical protein [Caudoviricetes sp.]
MSPLAHTPHEEYPIILFITYNPTIYIPHIGQR